MIRITEVYLGIVISFIIFLFSDVFGSQIFAQVVINEVSPLSNPEWVELYNTSVTEDASLTDCTLQLDATTVSQKVTFQPGDTISSQNKFRVVTWSSSWLNNSGDTVVLACPQWSDSLAYGSELGATIEKPSAGLTIGRSPDGSGNFAILASPTEGSPNSSPPSPTPTSTSTPTPTLSSTPTPTRSPSPTKTPTPTKIPTSTKTPTPTKTKLSVGGSEDNPQVLSETTEDSELSLASTPQVLSFETNTDSTQSSAESPGKTGGVPATAVLMIAGGVVFLGIGAVSIVRRRKSPYNEIDNEEIG